MPSELISQIFSNGLQSAIPEGDLTISEWAGRYRYVSAERSARPGLWRNEVTPYLVGIMDSVTEPSTEEVVFMKSSQVAGTEFLNNCLGYYIDIDPSPILFVAENEGKAQAWSVESLAPMIRDTPALASKIAVSLERDSSNTMTSKSFPGGHLAIVWASSPATLSSRPRRIVLFDEVDAFLATKEGDPVDLAKARTKTFKGSRKILLCSSPRDKETSVIEPLYDLSDQRKYFVPCPHCDEYQVLNWSNVKWDEGAPENAYYICMNGCLIEHDEKAEMLASGEWRATAEPKRPGLVGFWINEIYSPFSSWGEMAVAFLEAKPFPDKLKVFVNTRLAQTWDNKQAEIDLSEFNILPEDYEAEVPDGVLYLTAGVDTQPDRLECEVVGWGKDFESWSIDYRVFHGAPSEKEVWAELKEYLQKTWQGASQTYRVRATCVDSGGHNTNDVYRFVKQNIKSRFFAIKGASVAGKPLVSKPSVVSNLRVKLFTVGTETAKDQIYANLKKTISANKLLKDNPQVFNESGQKVTGYCHFPNSEIYNESYFRGLFSEHSVIKYVKGKSVRTWEKINTSVRNEPLDTRVYALAALSIINPNFAALLNRKAVQVEDVELAENSSPEPEIETKVVPELEDVVTLDEIIPEKKKKSKWNRGFAFGRRGKSFTSSW
jgi:phage terminase large subunit GpA-like protein